MWCKMDRLYLFLEYRRKYGEIAQAMVAHEELCELGTAISQYYRGRDDADHVIEEIADVMICCEQLILNMSIRHGDTYDNMEDKVRDIKLKKIKRMAERIGDRGK